MGCIRGYPVDACSSCDAFDYCIEYSDEMSYEDYLKIIYSNKDNNSNNNNNFKGGI